MRADREEAPGVRVRKGVGVRVGVRVRVRVRVKVREVRARKHRGATILTR